MSQKFSSTSKEKPDRGEGKWHEYYPKLQQYCRFLTNSTWDGDDIAQETFLKAGKYPEHQLNPALLKKIAYHHWIDLLRKRQHETIEANIELAKHDAEVVQPDQLAATVEQLIKACTPKQAVILLLKEAFQYQSKEIAELLNSTEMAVKAGLHRLKKRLEKASDEQSSQFIESFWNEEERENLTTIFYEALKRQDPTVLIQVIRTIPSISETPRCLYKQHSHSSPSSTLCMAA